MEVATDLFKKLLESNNTLVREIKGLRSDLVSDKLDECEPKMALRILGLNNPRYLKYFIDIKLLTRRKGGTSYLYYKHELIPLSEKIKSQDVIVPAVKRLKIKK